MRISENSTLGTVRDSLNRSRLKMNDLYKQNSTQKRVNTPSDDPVGNAKIMTIRNTTLDNKQFEANANLAKTFLNYTDASLEEITNLLVRAKELALGQASSAANGPSSRLMVAEEVKNIYEGINSLANRKLGDRYIFSGYKTNTPPFDDHGTYKGDDGKIMVEVQKDSFVSMNLPGRDVFLGKATALERSAAGQNAAMQVSPEGAVDQQAARPDEDMFRTLNALRVGLMTNDVDMIRSTLDPIDQIRNRVIMARAQVGARSAAIDTSNGSMDRSNTFNAELQSNIEDADMISVVSDLAREETVLRASLQATNKLVQPTLLDFLR